MLNDYVQIPLKDLRLCPDNIRKTHNPEAIKELAASIRAHGLIQPLLVREDDNTSVIAGGGRLEALKQLADDGHLTGDTKISCTVAKSSAESSELSLAENVVREAMHPIDQAMAFQSLVNKKTKIEDIAMRFGVSPLIVDRRLALATVSPKVLEAFRNGKITLSQAQAFALRNEHGAQEAVLEEFDPGYNDADDIRAALTDDGFVRADDKRVKFVGLDSYAAAGGAFTRDLFLDGPDGVYLHDEIKLDALAREKLQQIAQEVQQEGWSWIEHDIDYSWAKYAHHKRLDPETVELDAAQELTLEDLKKKLIEATDLYKGAEDGSEEEDRYAAQCDEYEDMIDKIKDQQTFWTEKQKMRAGAIITIDSRGNPEIQRGMVRPKITKIAPKKKGEKEDVTDAGKEEDGKAIPDIAQYSASLVETLSAHRSAAIGARVAKNHHIALVLLAYQAVADVIDEDKFDDIDLDIRFSKGAYPSSFDEKGVCIGLDQLQEQRQALLSAIPEDAQDGKGQELLTWLSSRSQETLLDYIALATGLSVNTTYQNPDPIQGFSSRALAEQTGLNMNEYFVPDAENFFERLSALQILAVLQQAGVTVKDEWKRLKKKDLCLLAEGELHATNPLWLPDFLSNREKN